MAFSNVDVTSLRNALTGMQNQVYMARNYSAQVKGSISGSTSWQGMAKDKAYSVVEKIYTKEEELLNLISTYNTVCNKIEEYKRNQSQISSLTSQITDLNTKLYKDVTTTRQTKNSKGEIITVTETKKVKDEYVASKITSLTQQRASIESSLPGLLNEIRNLT